MSESDNITIDSVIENLISIYPLLSKSFTRSIRSKTNLNPGSLFILGILDRNGILSMSEIGCKLSMPKPHVTAQVDKLIAENMVERLFDPSDRRIVNIKLTEKGKTDFESIKVQISHEMRQSIETLDENKVKILFESSCQVREILSEIMTEKSHSPQTCCKQL